MSLPLVDSEGRVYCILNTAPLLTDQFNAGIRYSGTGQMHVDQAQPIFDYSGGRALDRFGSITSTGVGVPIGHNGGWPYAADNKVRVQVDVVPAATDPYISGGIRVGPTGGLYLTTAAPP